MYIAIEIYNYKHSFLERIFVHFQKYRIWPKISSNNPQVEDCLRSIVCTYWLAQPNYTYIWYVSDFIIWRYMFQFRYNGVYFSIDNYNMWQVCNFLRKLQKQNLLRNRFAAHLDLFRPKSVIPATRDERMWSVSFPDL